jgi:ProP effector
MGTNGEPSEMPARAARIAAAKATIEQLATRFQKTFFVYERRRPPLKVGIDADLIAVLNGSIDHAALKNALRYYVHNIHYLRACVAGAARIDLAGDVAGVVTAREAEHARLQRLQYATRRSVKKVEAAAVTAGPPAEAPARLSLASLKAAAAARRQKEIPATEVMAK